MAPSPLITMALLERPLALEADALRAVLAGLPHDAAAVLDSVADDGTSAQITVDGRLYSVMSIAEAAPAETFSDAMAQPGNTGIAQQVSSHAAHLVVACLQPGLDMGEVVLAAAGAHYLAAHLGALGQPLAGFWEPSGQLAAWDAFTRDADIAASSFAEQAPPTFPARFWVAVQLGTQDDLMGGVTRGLLPFTGYELELAPLAWSESAVALRLIGTVAYLFENGPVLQDGETIGATEAERFRIALDGSAGLMRLTLDGRGTEDGS